MMRKIRPLSHSLKSASQLQVFEPRPATTKLSSHKLSSHSQKKQLYVFCIFNQVHGPFPICLLPRTLFTPGWGEVVVYWRISKISKTKWIALDHDNEGKFTCGTEQNFHLTKYLTLFQKLRNSHTTTELWQRIHNNEYEVH